MKSPFKPTPKRILLINFDGMSVYTLEGEKLTHIARFSDEESGLESFQFYLADTKKTPVTILVDSVAEDFLVENVAHTGPLDRAAILKRKSDQHFRGAEYKSARVLGRIDSGRKDDRVLFSALTKNQGIDPWISVLLKEEVPIQCITTPPFALCKVADQYDLMTSDSILLVNWEKSGIRQTLIDGKKVMFSRLTPLPTYNADNPAAAIIETCQQSKEYLERIGLLPFDAKLDVHIITPHLDFSDFQEYQNNNSFGLIEHHNSIDMIRIDRFSGAQNEITAVLLCLDLGIRTGSLKNIYAPSPVLRFYHLKQARRLIAALSIAVMVLGIIVSTPVLFGAFERTRNVEGIRAEIRPIQQNYDDLTAQFPETPIPSDAMALAVGTFNLIENQIENPTQMMLEIGNVLAEFPNVSLTTLDWNLLPAVEGDEFTDSILTDNLTIDVRLFGILEGARDVEESEEQLQNLIAALSQLDNISVSTISRPISTSSDSEIITVLNDQAINAEFGLSIKRGS